MTVLVTGAAGFIGFHVSAALLQRGENVLGVDNLSDYYSVALKKARLRQLTGEKRFRFHRLDLAGKGKLESLLKKEKGVDRVIHLAAQPGVRYSLENPRAYVNSNLVAQLEVLEACRHLKGLKHLVFASSSSVYGGNTKLPFAEGDPVDHPQSLYAATKKADELMSYCYAQLFRLPMTGLRFFTVYGPWGRPEMATWLFTEAIIKGKPIRLYNHGKMRRDFTYIGDAVNGVLACLDRPPADAGDAPPYRIYNLGNSRSEELTHFVAILERALGKRAKIENLPMQPGEVLATYADIAAARRDFGFKPATTIEQGLPRFTDWYRRYHKL
jgi:UDP-glucuronate 4-epimerase